MVSAMAWSLDRPSTVTLLMLLRRKIVHIPDFHFFSINTAHLQSMCERERYSAMTKKGNNDNDYRTSHWQLLLY